MLKKIIATLIIILLSLSILTSSVRASLESQKSDLEDKKEEVQEKKEEVQEEKSAVMKEVEKLTDSIEENEDKLADINSQLIKLNKEITEIKKELEKTQEKYNKQEEALKEKMIFTYEMEKTTYLDGLLNSKGILDFISNYYLISEILQNDNDLLESIAEQKNKIEKDKKKIEDKQKEVKTQKAEQEKINVVLSNQKTQKQNKVSQLSEEEKKLQKEIDKYNSEIRRVENEIRNAAINAGDKYTGSISGSGVLAWPLPYKAKITSHFGNREQPVPGASTNHRGIDIGVPVGTKVYSAADGYVVTRGYSSVRGYYIMVKHADNLYTFYQHLNSFAAQVGQNVKKGATIAYSGNSGIGSGPHLHFEVRTGINYGSEVNPLNYL